MYACKKILIFARQKYSQTINKEICFNKANFNILNAVTEEWKKNQHASEIPLAFNVPTRDETETF